MLRTTAGSADPYKRARRAPAAGALIGLLLSSTSVIAQESVDNGTRPDYDLILKRLERQDRRLTEQERRLAEQQREIEQLRQRLAGDSGPRTAVFTPPDPGDEGSGLRFVQDVEPVAPEGMQQEEPVAPTEPDEGAPLAPREEAPEGEITGAEERPEAEAPTEQLLVERGGVLLPRGTLQIEPSFEYEHQSRDRVSISGFSIFNAILIGTIGVDDLNRDILTAAVTTRYGITNRLQAEVRVPYVYRQDQELLDVNTPDQRERDVDGNDLGDVEASLSYQVLSQRDWVPATILRADAVFPTGKHPFEIERESVPGRPTAQRLSEAPTGSGFYGAGPAATFVWRLDPAVAFSGVGYTFNLSRDFGEFGEIDPGDTFEWFVGSNIALSELVSLNLSFVNQITFETEQNGQETPGSDANDARLVLGSSIGLTPRMSLVASAGAGLTDDSPDFNFRISVPINFQVFD